MNELAQLCSESNIKVLVAGYVVTLAVEWWLPKSRFKADSIGDVLVGVIGLVTLLVVVVTTAIFRRIYGTRTKGGNSGNQGGDRRP